MWSMLGEKDMQRANGIRGPTLTVLRIKNGDWKLTEMMPYICIILVVSKCFCMNYLIDLPQALRDRPDYL